MVNTYISCFIWVIVIYVLYSLCYYRQSEKVTGDPKMM